MKSLARLFVFASLFVLPSLTHAQNPDPRDYEVGYFVPSGTTIINTYLRNVSSTKGPRDFAAQALALRATYILRVGDVVITPFDAILPIQNLNLYPSVSSLGAVFGAGGDAAAPLAAAFGAVPSDLKLAAHASGVGDITYLPTIGHGLEQNAQDKTHTWYALTAYITAPTGQYDKTKLLNIGSNRWTIQPLVMIGQRFAKAFTVEATASSAFYTANSEYRPAFSPIDFKLTQKPSFGAQFHFAVDLHPMFFVGLSYNLGVNGERTREAAAAGSAVDAPSNTIHTLRVNFGIRITPQTLVLAQWNEDLAGSDNAVIQRFFGLRLTHAFFTPAAPPQRAPITDPAGKPIPSP